MNKNTNKLVKISLLSAIALILRYIEFPVIPMFPWLQMDFSDVPALLGAFGFGPIVGVAIELIKNILIILIKGTVSGFVGEVANFLFGSALVVPAAIIYRRNKSKKSAILGMLLGGIFMGVSAIVINIYVLLPAYGMQMSPDQALQYVTMGLLPFNGIKAILVSILTYALYKKVSVSIFKVEPNFGAKYLVAKIDNKVVGFVGTWVVLDESHITNIAVHPNYRNQGIASKLLESLLSYCKSIGCIAYTLEVRATNKSALSLYIKHGFKKDGIRKGYYQDNKEDAILMWLKENPVD